MVFSALGSRHPEAVKSVHNLGATGFFVSAKTDDWYQAFDPKPMSLMLRAFKGAKIGFGVSMGGFGVLQHADALGLDRVMVCSPQVYIDPDLTPDPRWTFEWNALKARGAMRNSIARVDDAQVFAFIDPQEPMDVWQARRLPAHARIIGLHYASHAVANEMVARGLWGAFLAAVATGDLNRLEKAKRNFIRARRSSYVRRVSLARALVQRGRHTLAETVFHTAIALEPERHHAYHFLGELHESRGNLRSAAAAAEDAIAHFNVTDGPMQGLYQRLAHLYGLHGDLDRAEDAYHRGLARLPGDQFLTDQRDKFLRVTGRMYVAT